MRRQAEGFMSDVGSHSAHLVEDPARLDDGHPIFGVALSLAHSSFRRFFGDGLVWENSRPHLAPTLHIPGNRDARRFDLTASYPSRLQCFEPKFAERDVAAPVGLAAHPPLHHFSEFDFFRCYHNVLVTYPSRLSNAASGLSGCAGRSSPL